MLTDAHGWKKRKIGTRPQHSFGPDAAVGSEEIDVIRQSNVILRGSLFMFVATVTFVSIAQGAGPVSPHPWLPPFGLDRIGANTGADTPPFEADAAARPDEVINPVDLGAILVPQDWLLLKGGQGGVVKIAAISHGRDISNAEVRTWYDSGAAAILNSPLSLKSEERVTLQLPLPKTPEAREDDTLHVIIVDAAGEELWGKSIPVMIVQKPPTWPEFGATETKLRYDGPISLRAEDGTLSELDYDQGWDPKLSDVVVSLPNGARYVFWRGSSYVPFWAGRFNTGLCYEWAETLPPPDGFVDSVEPLMDKELRYGRVSIVESTAARVHVRWTYQSCDFNYKVWGDSATEDYYFYPDGFGTRHLTLQSALDGDYELSEVIILTPQAAYPFDVLPSNLADVLFLNNQTLEITTPVLADQQAIIEQSPEIPAIYRIRLNKEERLSGVYFNPQDVHLPAVFFAPFQDQGQIVTPAYWGSHWPLARGKSTGGQIDDRITITPAHNSLMSWAFRRPEPLRSVAREATDTLGRRKPMKFEEWAWLIGMTEATDEELLARARSYAAPPALRVEGGTFEAQVPERRSSRMRISDTTILIRVAGKEIWVNPVLELSGATKPLSVVSVNDKALEGEDYRWDGAVLWINRVLMDNDQLRLVFGT